MTISSPPPNLYRVTAWVGPCGVGKYTEKLRTAGAEDVAGGTEHVYCTIPAYDELGARMAVHKILFGNDHDLWGTHAEPKTM